MAEGLEKMQRFYDELLSDGNFDVIDEIVADDIVDHEAMPDQPEGKDGVRWFIELLRAGFSDIKVTMGPALESGDLASAQFTITAKHTGEFMGVPASAKQIEIETIDIVRVADGKCAEHWGVTDNMALMQQIGAVPAAA
jgi:steroid delta-isomerase-like uncharacterized protein